MERESERDSERNLSCLRERDKEEKKELGPCRSKVWLEAPKTSQWGKKRECNKEREGDKERQEEEEEED